jgi:hypothetical protein
MVVSVVWPGLLVGGAEGREGSRADSAPGPMLCDLELLGGGPGGGGGIGMLRPQGTMGDSSMGVRVSVPWPSTPADAALREAGARRGD